MKKVLFATTALVMTAGFAAADVTISGYGRFGLSYYGDGYNKFSGGKTEANDSKTWLEQRMRLNIKASTETDGGVEFGGKLRIQYDDGKDAASLNAAQLYFSYEGATVQLGNVTTAVDEDNSGLFYASEIGVTDSSFGDSRTDFYTYKTGAYDDSRRNGVYGKYTIAGFTAEASYIDPNQYGSNSYTVTAADGTTSDVDLGKNETSVNLSYVTGDLTLAAGGIKNGAGIDKNNLWYAAGAYDFTEEFRAGLTYISEGKTNAGYDLGKTITVYGSYTTGPVEVLAYVANYTGYDDELDSDYDKDVVYGIGANYDLGGGTTLRGALHRDAANETYGEFGVKFNF